MRKRTLGTVGVVLVAGVVVVGLLASGSSAAFRRFDANMNGQKETDGAGNFGLGDPNGRGKAVIRVNPARQRLCFRLAWSRIRRPSMAHIHEGRRSQAGDVVVALFLTGDEAAAGDQDLPATIKRVGGCVNVGRALARRIRNNPRQFYVNVHNDQFPGGAIRGQLRPAR